ncbi:MAG TPA: glycoside hydrolase family 130 protein [Balneolales bacterium]|nr:glycoside hydrolase family 130 protein [Balneolales bacterium]
MGPIDSVTFMDPILKKPVRWEAKDVFNPAAVVRNDTIYLLYRAEDLIGKYKGTSRVGLAWSTDGTHFTRDDHPVLYPADDDMKTYEWEGGTEDPRIVQDEQGTYYLTYTAYDGKTARLCEATSKDLRHWTKQGPVFAKADNGKYLNLWSKSGAIVTKRDGDHMIATKINGKYWMYWGDTNIYLATSDNLIDWTPVQDSNGNLMPAIRPRKGKFDSQLVESGPPAMITKNGILLIYNSSNAADSGDTALPAGTYSAGQALFSANDPGKLKERLSHYFFTPERRFEKQGQVDNVTFLEGLVPYKGTWYLYYGAADSTICVATYKPGE